MRDRETLNMAEPPELWTFLVFNLIVLIFGAILAAFSYATYRRSHRERFRHATIAFGLVTLGGLIEPVYQLVVKDDYRLAGRELLAVQSVEGLLMGAGLALLLYSIYASDRIDVRDEMSADLENDWRP